MILCVSAATMRLPIVCAVATTAALAQGAGGRLTPKCAISILSVNALVLDSSALITLATGDGLALLGRWPGKVYTVAEVYRETVEIGGAVAFPDARAIGHSFQRNVITVRGPRRRDKLSGLSETDSLVVHLAAVLERRNPPAFAEPGAARHSHNIISA